MQSTMPDIIAKITVQMQAIRARLSGYSIRPVRKMPKVLIQKIYEDLLYIKNKKF